MKIAIASPLKTEQAETFIQNHINNLPFDKVVIYGGVFPYLTDKHQPTIWDRRFFRLRNIFKKITNVKWDHFNEYYLAKIIKKEKVEVIFTEYLITGAEILKVGKLLNIPIVPIALGYDISTYAIIKQYTNKYKALFNYSKNIIIVSKHMKENLLTLGCKPNKIVYSPAAPDLKFFKNQPSFQSNQVLAVGRFVDKKAPHLTILAFQKVLKKVPQAQLVFAGDGYLLNTCKDLVKTLTLENSVKFIGKITPQQHIDLLKASQLFVQHSKIADNGDSEGTPVAILEASASGLPIVSTLHAGIPDVVIQNKTGFLVPEYDIEQMAEHIIYLLKNKQVAKEMGAQGRAFIKENFTLEKHIATITQCINEAKK
ncbi:glycosyltransferase [Lutibacter aestuarii]|uniref:Glycosyltransferase n=1 Tax=Lutibacter aestuarii TaxID=861111 RepID=A0ABW2Z754_9FLAO